MTSDETTISIMGQEVSARHQLEPIDRLRFLPDNPRVYAAIREMSDFPTLTPGEKQDRIYRRLLEEPSVKNLIPEILRDGGLQDPIIVRHDTWQVIEGNSRLAVYRKLQLEHPDNEKWMYIRCVVVPTLTDEQQTRLFGQAHLHGKTDWSPYVKALFCFRWVEEDQKDTSVLVKVSGLTADNIRKNVEVIRLMQENDDNTLSNFSFYDTLVRTRKISSAIESSVSLRNTVLSQIKTKDKRFTAIEMRKRLPEIIAKPRILKKYEKGDISLEDAYDRAKISHVEQQIKKIRERLDDIQGDDIKRLERSELRAVEQTVRQIRQHVRRISGMIEKELDTTPSSSKTNT